MTGLTPPPHDVDAELAVLGALILDVSVMADVAPLVTVRDFYVAHHRLLWEALVALEGRGDPVDSVTVKDELRRAGTFDKAGGAETLIRAMEAATTSGTAKHHAQIVRDKAALRRMIDACRKTEQAALAAEGDADEILEAGESAILAARSGAVAEMVREQDMFRPLIDDIEARRGRPNAVGIPTGFADLDALIGGLRPGSYNVIGARSSMGKSSLSNNIATNAALGGVGVAIFTLEVKARQVAENHLIARAGLDSARVASGDLTDREWGRVFEWGEELANAAPILLIDKRGITPSEMRAMAQRAIARYGVGLLVVDYLGLMRGPKAENKQQEVTAISAGLQAMAGDLDVPLVALSQLNRSVDARDDHRPRMSDLRESGSIEQDADMILLLNREEYWLDKEGKQVPDDKRGVTDVIVAKNRNGPTGGAKLWFRKESLRFFDLARKGVAAPPPR